MKNRKNNKGFSLVELIVVVAIMAVLVGVLAPAYLRYVEKSRIQKDDSAVAEIVETVKVAAAEEECFNVLSATAKNVGKITLVAADDKLTWSATVDGTADALDTAIKASLSDYEFVSKAWTELATAPTITVKYANSNVVVEVGGAPATSAYYVAPSQP